MTQASRPASQASSGGNGRRETPERPSDAREGQAAMNRSRNSSTHNAADVQQVELPALVAVRRVDAYEPAVAAEARVCVDAPLSVVGLRQRVKR